MHPYEMQLLLLERHKAELLVLKRGSVYNAIGRLTRTGLIEAAGTGRSGNRPERTTYRITGEGREQFITVLEEMVGHPQRESSEFTTALSFLVHLAPDVAIAKLEERASRLDEEIRETTTTLKSALPRVQRINLIESEYDLAMRRAESKWVRGLIGELQSGSLRWDTKTILRDARKGQPVTRPKREKKEKQS